jgi:SAM-dependent methyltransferase
MSKIRFIKTNDELLKVTEMLKDFYLQRPDGYKLLDRKQSDYDQYVNTISQWTIPRGKVLDLGCGTYRTVLSIHQKGFEATGCDLFSDEKLKEYRKQIGENGPKLVSYDGCRLPFEDESFDTIATLCVLEHVSFVDSLLKEIDRVLRPQGRIIIIGPNLSGPHRAVLGMVHLLKGDNRFWQFSTIFECIRALVGFFLLTAEIYLSKIPVFILIYPLLENDMIKFEQPDDDAIHLNAPLSYKKWFQTKGFHLDEYNNHVGDSALTGIFNKIFPDFATKIQIVAQKIQTGKSDR